MKKEEVNNEYVEVNSERLEPEPIILKFSKSRGVTVVDRVPRRQEKKAANFGDLSFETEDLEEEIVEPAKKYRRGPKSRKRLLEIKTDEESPKKVKVSL